jgi:hypothetical protein
MAEIHRYKLLQQFYPELRTTAERIKKYHQEHYSDDPLKILKQIPDAPRLYDGGSEQGPKVETVPTRYETPIEVPPQHHTEIHEDPNTGAQTVAMKKYNLFRDVFPKLDCPKCGHKKSMQLRPLCGGCKEAQGGKFKTAWRCLKCNHEEVSDKGITQWWKELTGGKEFYANLPDGHGFIPKIYLDDERKAGD